MKVKYQEVATDGKRIYIKPTTSEGIMEHTPGPWETQDGFVRSGPLGHPDTKPICYIQTSARKPNVAEANANARRIVSCVNACKDMSDPEAEIKRLKRYDETPKCHHGHVSLPLHLWDCPTCTEQLRRDKAELVKALKKIFADSEEYYIQDIAEVAIAKHGRES
ncbi:MAG: hypothetical protein E3J60_04720 [Dehalococcoidia bacterium]|nr:MAG: hypothetical protein E3J60_04720 [Dehalococcoidia bacterium]